MAENDRNLTINAVGHSFGGGSAVHLLADEKCSETFDKIVGLGPSLGVGLTQEDWSTILKMDYTTKTLHVHEDLYLKKLSANSIHTRFTAADRNFGDYEKQKHFIITVNDCGHIDIFDEIARPVTNFSWLERKLTDQLSGGLGTSPLVSFENQIFLVCSFLNGYDVNQLGGRYFREGVPKKSEIDMKVVEKSVARLMKSS